MAEIALLDGGLGQEINKCSQEATHPLWSVKVMFDAPDIVIDVHSEFIEAGARVICLNTYTATPTRMERHGLGNRLEEAHATAFQLAKTAISNTVHSAELVQVAGCIPPLVASYISDVSKDYSESLIEFRQIVALQKDFVDVFLIETMSNIEEASAALDAAKETEIPVYVALTVSDDLSNTLRSGERLEDAIAALVPKKPDGILLNCSIPEAITKAMPMLANAGVRYGGYANGFTSIEELQLGGNVDVLKSREGLTPAVYTEYIEKWIDLGATIVGGCCEVSPEHIKFLATKLRASGHTITSLR